jgi:hypothetical protein
MVQGEQATAMVNAWAQGATKVWETWVEALTPPGGGGPALARLLPHPEPLASLFRATASAWEAAGRHFVGGPQSAVGAWLDELTRHPWAAPAAGAPDVPGAARDAAGLWDLYVETIRTLSRPWVEASARTGDPRAAPDVSGLTRFSDLSWDVLERTFGRLLQSPSIGFTRELNEKLLGAFNAWLEFKRATMDYQVALSAALFRSTTAFLQELAVRAGRGEPINGLRELLRLWGDTLDEMLIESFRSDEYASVQGRLVRAAMSYRIREREAVDVLLKIGHVPTRRDIDEVSRSLYELRREVRAVAKSVPGMEGVAREAEDLADAVPGLRREVGNLAKAIAGPEDGSPSAAKPPAAKTTAAKPTAGKPTAGKPTAGKPTAGEPIAGRPRGKAGS